MRKSTMVGNRYEFRFFFHCSKLIVVGRKNSASKNETVLSVLSFDNFIGYNILYFQWDFRFIVFSNILFTIIAYL